MFCTLQSTGIQSGLLIQPQNMTAYEGTDIVLLCNPHQSTPPAQITWTHNGWVLDPESDSRRSVAPSGNLYIAEANVNDTGFYRCTATNPVTGARRRSDEVALTIQGTYRCVQIAAT